MKPLQQQSDEWPRKFQIGDVVAFIDKAQIEIKKLPKEKLRKILRKRTGGAWWPDHGSLAVIVDFGTGSYAHCVKVQWYDYEDGDSETWDSAWFELVEPFKGRNMEDTREYLEALQTLQNDAAS